MRWFLCLFILLCNGCLAGAAAGTAAGTAAGATVGAAVGITTEIIKAPFTIGGAIIDAVSDDDEDE